MADFPQLPGDGRLRFTGAAPTLMFGPLRVTQQAAEVLFSSASDLHVTQQAAEALYQVAADVRVTQQAIELLWGPAALLRVSQQVIEVLYPSPSAFYDCGVPTLTPDDLCRKRNVFAWVEWDVDASTTLTYEA